MVKKKVKPVRVNIKKRCYERGGQQKMGIYNIRNHSKLRRKWVLFLFRKYGKGEINERRMGSLRVPLTELCEHDHL
jgi:hypothetical protein